MDPNTDRRTEKSSWFTHEDEFEYLNEYSPPNNSSAASEVFRSDFHDEIKRWQTKWVAFTNNRWDKDE